MTGTELAKWRMSHNYTQAELAGELEVSTRTLIRWEGEGPLPLARYVELALKGLLFTHRESCRCPQCGGNPGRTKAELNRVYDPYSKSTN